MIVKLGVAASIAVLGISAVVNRHGDDDTRRHAGAVAASTVSPATVAPLPVQAAATPALVAAATSPPTLLPARLLNCTLGRITNFDPSRIQAPSEYVYEGRHPFRLFLPAIPTRTTPPPSATAPAEPVNPQTKIVADPDGIAIEAHDLPFDRVVDLWPERVEMTTPISDVANNLIIIDRIDAAKGQATLFMTKANDAVTFDLKHLYLGTCRVSPGATLIAAAR